LVEEHVPVVHRSIAILWADVANCDALKRFVGGHVADLDDEGVRPVVDEFFGIL
jgi:hypothetical protein